MSKRGKKYIEIKKKREDVELSLQEAIQKVKKLSFSKFVGSLELHLALNLPKDKDPKSIKGSLSLPHSTSKGKRVAVFTTEENQKVATKAGADIVGLESLIKEVQGGKIDFDVAIATADVMPKIAILGKELGPKGLMPNPKLGTVTTPQTLEEAIKAYKKGKSTFSADTQGGIHMSVGKINQEDEQLIENINAVISTVEDAVGKPYNQIAKKFTLSPTMGPSVKVKFEKE